MKSLKILLFSVALFISSNTLATAQYGDILIQDSDTVEIYSNPLEYYLKDKNSRIIDGYNLLSTSSACWRGYQATWLLKNDSLFLIRIRKGCANWNNEKPIYLDLSKEFGTKVVFANWVSEVIWKPEGELIQYIHMGYGSIFEREKNYFIKNGLLDTTETIKNVIYEEGKILPSERKISDTLKKILIESINPETILKFQDKEVAFISVRFNSEGEIDSIFSAHNINGKSFFENKILEIAQNSFNDFTPLMRVKHERFKYTQVQISVNSHCLKFPNDYDYGCGR